jgi:hypothetical protein
MGSNLYLAGYFATAGGITVNNIACWDGTTFYPLSVGTNSGSSGTVYALAVMGSDLFVGGQFSTAGAANMYYITRWNGTNFLPLKVGASIGVNTNVYALAVIGSDLYVGGGFTTATGVTVNYVTRWNGTAFHPLQVGSSVGLKSTATSGVGVHSLAVNGSELYIGGFFTSAGGMVANNIARWNGTNFFYH